MVPALVCDCPASTLTNGLNADAERVDKVRGSRDNVLKLHIRQPVIAVQVSLLNDLVCHKLHLLGLQLFLSTQALDGVNKIFFAEVSVIVKVCI